MYQILLNDYNKKSICIYFLILILTSCYSEKTEKKDIFFSVNKWTFFTINNSVKLNSNNFNFYNFQDYLNEQLKLESNLPYVNESLLFNYIKKTIINNDIKLEMMTQIKSLNLNTIRDSSVLLLDLVKYSKKKYTLLSLGYLFSFQTWGSNYTGNENYLISQKQDSIILLAELPQGILRGVYFNKEKKITKLIFEDFCNSYNEYNAFGSNYLYELQIKEKSISFSKVLNVRNGEPLDYTDKTDCFEELKNFKYIF